MHELEEVANVNPRLGQCVEEASACMSIEHQYASYVCVQSANIGFALR